MLCSWLMPKTTKESMTETSRKKSHDSDYPSPLHLRKLSSSWQRCNSGISTLKHKSLYHLLQLLYKTPNPWDHMLAYNTHTNALKSRFSSPEMVRSGERHCKSNSFLTLAHPWTSAQKKATFPSNEFAQGAMLIPDLIIADSEHKEWLI